MLYLPSERGCLLQVRHHALNCLISDLFELRLTRLQRINLRLVHCSLLKIPVCIANFSVVCICLFVFQFWRIQISSSWWFTILLSRSKLFYFRLKLLERILKKSCNCCLLWANNMKTVLNSWSFLSVLKELDVLTLLQAPSLPFKVLMLVLFALSMMRDYFIYSGFVLGLTIAKCVDFLVRPLLSYFLWISSVWTSSYEGTVLQALKEVHWEK